MTIPFPPIDEAFFFFNDTAPTEIYTLSLHDALPIFHAARHRDVGEYQAYATLVRERSQGGRGAGDARDAEADRLQHFRREGRHLIIVLDQEHLACERPADTLHGGVALVVALGVTLGMDLAGRLCGAGQEQADSGALAGLALNVDMAAGLRDEAINLGEAEARSLADLLGREEGIKHARQEIGGNARSVVRDRKLDDISAQRTEGKSTPVARGDADHALA